MAELESLQFSVSLDDTAFRKQITELETLAQTLNTDMTKLLEMKSKVSKTTSTEDKRLKEQVKSLKDKLDLEEKIRREREKTLDVTRQQAVAERQITATQRARQTTETDSDTQRIDGQINRRRELNNLMKKGNDHLFTQNKIMRELATMAGAYISVMGAQRILSNLVRISAEFELQKTTLRAILQDAQKADAIFAQIKELAVKSPFQFKELATYAKQLSAYSIPVNELYDTTKMLADVSAGLGVDMNRLVLAYGQIRSASFLRGQEVRQLTEAGIPILEELRKQFQELNGEVLTAGDVFDKISTRQVSFEMVAKVFKDMTSEGGKFYKMQEVQAETLKGKLSNLTDAFQIMFSEIGEKNSGLMKGSVEVIYKLVENYEKLGRALITVISTYGAYRAATKVFSIIQWAENVAVAGERMRNLGINISNAGVALRRLGISMKALNLATITGAIVGLGVGIYQAARNATELARELKKVVSVKFAEAQKSADTFTELVSQLRKATEGSETFREVISRLNRQYGEYLPNLLNEKNALAEIAKNNDLVINSIYNKAKAYAYEEGIKKIDDDLVAKTQNGINALMSIMGNLKISSASATAFIQKFKETVVLDGDVNNAYQTFLDTFRKFFDGGYEDSLSSMAYWAEPLAKQFIKAETSAKSFQTTLDAIFGKAAGSYASNNEMNTVNAIIKSYEDAKQAAKDAKMSQEELNAELKRLELSKVYDLVEYYRRLAKEDGGIGARADKLKQYEAQYAAMTQKITGWQEKADNVLKKYGFGEKNTLGLWADNNTSAISFIEKVKKAYKELLVEDIEPLSNMNEKGKKDAEELIKQKKVLEEIAQLFGIVLSNKTIDHQESEANKKAKAQLETQISVAKNLLSQYQKIKDLGIDDETAKTWLNAFSPSTEQLNNSLKFKEVLMGYADTLEKVFDDPKGAESIRNIFAKDAVADAVDAYKKLESLRDKLQSWISEDFNISGEGIIFDLNKLASELNTKNNKVDVNLENLKLEFQKAVGNEEAIKAIRKKYGDEAWMAYIDAGEDALNLLATKEKAYNKYVAEEKVRDMAKNYIKEWDALKAFDLSDWSTKSVTELKDLQSAIDTFDPTRLPKTLRNSILEINGQEGLEKFIEAIIAELDKLSAKTEEQLKKDKIEQVKKLAGYVGDVAGSASDLSSALGNSALAKSLDMMEDLAKSVGSIYESIAEGKYAEAAVGGLAAIFQLAVSVISASQEAKQAIRDAKMEARSYNAELALSQGVDSIFGTNVIKNIQNAVNELNRLGKAVDEDKKKMTLMNAAFNSSTGVLTLGNRKFDLKKEVEKLGYELYDANGNLNSKALQAILDTYDGLNKESKKWLENAIRDSEEYANALAQLEDEVSNIFGSLADDMASSFIDKYIEIGDATMDLADQMDSIFGNLAKNIAKELVSAFIIDNVLAKYKNDAVAMMENMASGNMNETEIAQYFSTLAEGIKNDTEAAAEYTNRLLDALTAQGVTLGSESESSNSMSNGIKSITEDTANLLASYINAIRADVAANRITLTDIQTNTFRSAIAAEGILQKLTSVMGSFSGGGDGIKVVMS